jgi:pimeloyl-ACP methyl ester carboxylesterase
VQAASTLVDVVPTADFGFVADNERWPRGIFDREAFLAYFEGADLAALETSLAHAGRIAVGTYQSRDYRGAGGVFDADFVSGAALAPEVPIELVLVEPDPAVFPPPWPVTIVQHGFNGTAKDVLTRAAMFNQEGIATIGIDALEHGIRGSIVNFFNPDDVRVARENLRQTVLDHVQLCRLVVAGALEIDQQPGPDFDGTCNYFGQSMGGILGGLYAAVAPDTGVSVLNVPGGGMSRVLQSPVMGPQVSFIFAPALGIVGDPETWTATLPFFGWIAQNLLDPGDPVSFGPSVFDDPPSYARSERRVLLQIGVGDNVIPNSGSRALAAGMGVTERSEAVVDDNGVSGVWWVDPADYGFELDMPGGDTDPHNILNFIEGVRRQAAVYQASGGTEIADPASF